MSLHQDRFKYKYKSKLKIDQLVIMEAPQSMSFFTTVVALVNGMIGGSILVLPLVAKQGGWAEALFIILVTGVFSYYSCYLSLIHLGDQTDLDHTLLRHFNGSKFLKIFYDFCVWSGFMLVLVLYFELVVIQWQGLIPDGGFSIVNPIINAAVMLGWCLCLKFFEFGAHIMGYGIVSIAGYLIFLIWVIATAPSGNNTVPAIGTGAAGFAAMMGNAFSIQGFFIPVVRQFTNKKKHLLILLLAYIIGGLAYYYIAFIGAYGIVNRQGANAQTIEGFFSAGVWQVKVLQGIYLVHLYSVFPEYLLISKKRFFSMFGMRESKAKTVNFAELIYIIAMIIICLCLSVLRVNIDIIIDINGAVLGFCFVYFLPSLLHIKCLYFSKGKRFLPQLPDEEQQQKKQELSDHNSTRKNNSQYQNEENTQKQKNVYIQMLEQPPVIITDITKQQVPDRYDDLRILGPGEAERQELKDIDYSYFYCAVQKSSPLRQGIDLTLLTIMFLMGAFIMANGLIQVVDIIKG